MANNSRRNTIVVIVAVSVLLMSILDRFSKNLFSKQSVHAMSTNRQQHRVLCFGDSLTAGTSGMQLYPYAPYLEAKLSKSGNSNIVVRHRGMPGWTTVNMLNDLDGERTGLRQAIQAVKGPPLSLIILLAGSNDMGYGYSEQEITENILKLHQISYENGVPRSIAIGIPSSGYQSVNAKAAALAVAVNKNLQNFCAKEDRATFMPFPFPFEQGGQNWYTDGLHFSQQGYQTLGESLAPVVENVLKSINS